MTELGFVAELQAGLLAAVCLGGEARLTMPIGPAGAGQLIAAGAALAGQAGSEVQTARRLVARQLGAVDALPDVEAAEWVLLAALNDLLQVTNPSLTDWFGTGRPEKLLGLVNETIELAGPSATVGEALARHATFARVLELRRIDTRVSWWVGSERFVGARPPVRLLKWKRLRRVQQQETVVTLADMAPDDAEWKHDFAATLRRWLAATPLTDLATMARTSPPFVWTGATLGLVRTLVGRALALRAIERSGKLGAACVRASRATDEVGPREARDLANDFARELDAVRRHARAS